jgi:hypothetical protein
MDMKHPGSQFFFILAGILFFACTGQPDRSGNGKSGVRTNIGDGYTSPGDQPGTILAAETIVYDVEIINPYPDDPWMSEWLKDLDHQTAVDFVFAGIYRGKFKAYDIFEGTPVSARSLKKMELNGEFTRDKIGKFQFQEEWVLDTVNMKFTKYVTEIRMGVRKLNQDGMVTGYDPLVRVVL